MDIVKRDPNPKINKKEVREYQKKYGLKVDGIVGNQTFGWAKEYGEALENKVYELEQARWICGIWGAVIVLVIWAVYNQFI